MSNVDTAKRTIDDIIVIAEDMARRKLKTDLCRLMREERSDKGSDLSESWHNYTVFYSLLFAELRYKPVAVFEVGIGSTNESIPSNMTAHGRPGASLYAWSRFFESDETIIRAADIDTEIMIDTGRIKTYYVDQRVPEILNFLFEHKMNKMQFDVFVDDGLHEFEANKNTFEAGFDYVKPGGYYIIEDILVRDIPRFEKYFNDTMMRPLAEYFRIVRLPSEVNHADNVLLVIKKTA